MTCQSGAECASAPPGLAGLLLRLVCKFRSHPRAPMAPATALSAVDTAASRAICPVAMSCSTLSTMSAACGDGEKMFWCWHRKCGLLRYQLGPADPSLLKRRIMRCLFLGVNIGINNVVRSEPVHVLTFWHEGRCCTTAQAFPMSVSSSRSQILP